MKTTPKKEQLAGGFLSIFKPSAEAAAAAPAPEALAKPVKPRARAPKRGVSEPVAPPAAIPPPAPDPEAPFSGKLVACFRWQDGEKASAARSSGAHEQVAAPLTFKGATGRLPRLLSEGTRGEFIAYCEVAARESGAKLHYIAAKGGRARKHTREGKRPSEVGIAEGWRRYSVTIRTEYYDELEHMRELSGKSHKEIIDSALFHEFARMKTEPGKQRGGGK